jgi:two-component system cell cycle response regulator
MRFLRVPLYTMDRLYKIFSSMRTTDLGEGEVAKGASNARATRAGSQAATKKGNGDTPARVIIVEDDSGICSVLDSLLTRDGHHIQCCPSGEEAMAKLQKSHFDLVITDLTISGVDGLSILRRAKETDPSCEVIIVTAYLSASSIVEVMKLGAFACIIRPFDVDEFRAVVDKALEKRRLSRLDRLTELYDYRAFNNLLGAEFVRSERHSHSLSVVLVDLDQLGVHNRALGYPAGDRMLKEVGRLLKRSVRQSDVVTRYGGDEFAILLVETDEGSALVAANRLCRLVEEAALGSNELPPQRALTVSIGVAGYPSDAAEPMDLINKAGQALGDAQTLGGNLVRSAKTTSQ